MIRILLYALLGKLTIYLAQIFPFNKLFVIGKLWQDDKFLAKLFGCDLCLGVWIYWILAMLLKVNIFDEFGYIPILFEFFTGAAMSFIVHLISLGWSSKFRIYEIK